MVLEICSMPLFLIKSNLRMDGQEGRLFYSVKKPYSYTFKFGADEEGVQRANELMGTMAPAEYLVYERMRLILRCKKVGSNMAIGSYGPMESSFFLKNQLVSTINEPKVLVTVKRGEKTFITRVPRVKIGDLRINDQQKAELDDWHHEAEIPGKFSDLFYVPYNLTTDNIVQGSITYLNEESEEQFPSSSGARSIQALSCSGRSNLGG